MNRWLGLFLGLALAAMLHAAEPPVVPVGYDAYRQWERWPEQRIGVRAYMRSTYDRKGGNEGADASHYLYQLADNRNVALDVAGRGILYFARYNHWHGSPWHYVVDGTDHVVQESSTADPLSPVTNAVFLPTNVFCSPVAETWATTKGADLSWVPISFTNSFRMDYERTHYGTGYFIYDLFADDVPTSQPIETWTEQSDTNTARLFDCPSPSEESENAGTMEMLRPRENREFFSTNVSSPTMVCQLLFYVPTNEAGAFGNAKLRVWWDNRKAPSVDAPVALFFGAGTISPDVKPRVRVSSFPDTIMNCGHNKVLFTFFPMPFFKSARFEIIGPADAAISNIIWMVRSCATKEKPSSVGYFHATYRDHPNPEPGKDLVLLDTRETEGGGDWSGNFVGTSWIFSDRANLTTLEGDPRFFFDDSETPQGQGTGTEEWGGGGDYWGGQNMTLPFAGHPTGVAKPSEARSDEDKIESAYRFLLGDLMPFGKNARICLEHGGTDESKEHYQTVTYWYGAPAPSLIKTDVLKIGDATSERKHHYISPDATAPYSITSRYEWGVDHIKNVEIYPATTDTGRTTRGTSEFDLTLKPDNYGVLLRRKLDYSFPNQRAKVFVADKKGTWRPAGTWFLAGANTCVYSNPKGELGATQHIVETSNRRFRDDEFLISRKLTRGRSSIRIRVQFEPMNIPLFPGRPLDEQAWSEMRYDAYCYVLPNWRP